jgi:uncharacterized protein
VRVALTGASGLLGAALAEALVARGDRVVALVRGTSRPTGLSAIPWEPERRAIDREAWRLAGHLDAVVNLAGAGIGDRRWSAERRREILDSRVATTSWLVELLGDAGATTALLSASAIGVYGSRGDEVLDETSLTGSGFLARVCREWETAARHYETAGGAVTLLRTGVVLDARGGALARQLPLFRWGLGGRLGRGDQWMSPISLRDYLGAVLFLLDQTRTGPVNLVAREPVTNAAFTRALARALGRPSFMAVPGFALRAVLGGAMADELVLASQRVRPAALVEAGFDFAHPTIDTIVRAALG